MIRIRRTNSYDMVRAYKIILDGKKVGQIKNDQQIELEVLPGEHQLYLKIDWCRSNIIEFKQDDRMIEFECGNSVEAKNFWLPFIEIFYIIFKRKEYLWLKKVID
ncbi:hypothetical protein ACS127_13140 [Amphibacillus sp. Q70]|uniref:hypothetical protein n=1 Tax=Amphibacillus sp. Q70 TaxID=3453416 RepID=UPI003F83F6C4